MDQTEAAVEAALAANDVNGAVALLEAAASAPKGVPLPIFRRLATLLFKLQRYADLAKWADAGLKQHPKDLDLWNVLGVAYRRLGRLPEALEALERAQRLAPTNRMPVINKVNVYNDLHDGAKALPLAMRLVREDPKNAEFQRLVGVAYRHLGDFDKATERFELAIRLNPRSLDAWIDRVGIATGMQHHDEALTIIDRALQAAPDNVRLLENKAILLRRAGRAADAEAFLNGVLERNPATAWAHYQMARTIADERERANHHLRKALELEPNNRVFAFALAESLDRSRYGVEGEHIQEGYELMCRLLAQGPPKQNQISIARQLCLRVVDHERVAQFGSFEEIGRDWARTGNHAAFLQHIGRVQTPEDRLELVHQHRMWGDMVEANAARHPIVHPKPRDPDGRIRLGFMSSDLRAHPVAYFAMPVFEFIDPRFDVYCYSFYTGEKADGTQKYIMSQVKEFRWWRSISDRDAAQKVADDQLDILFELGGSTHMNKLESLAYKPAPIQASWLGYPHSAGLSTIDYLLTDPFITPTREGMLIEKPLMMPKSWISLGTNAFRESDVVNAETPQERNGYVTFGTANNPHKYGPEMLRVWARTVAAVPNSQFLFVRPEGNARSFRENLRRYFAMEGVAPERVKFAAVRGAHLPFYNEIDIALDTFPLTGGTTTCETLWMGVPVVSKVGDAFFERLSYSILNNAGLGDLASEDEAGFIDTAVRLAADHPRRKALRANLREQLKASPLGQRDVFAKDFYDLLARTVEAHRQKATS